MEHAPTLRVMGLHALEYCERLFYLEEVEEIRIADERVYAGRTLHEELDEEGELLDLTLESETLGIRGRFDALRRRDGETHVIEHKRGRAMRGQDDGLVPWPSDRLQGIAYALLLEEHTGEEAKHFRVRYHVDKRTLKVRLQPEDRSWLQERVAYARKLASGTERPAITSQPRRCIRCSLAPVCLPEETRLAEAAGDDETPTPVRLFPPDQERRSLHVVTQGARVGRSGQAFVVKEGKTKVASLGAREVSDIVVHGFAQVTTQALRLAANDGVPVHFITTTGGYIGTFTGHEPAVQRRLRQLEGLRGEDDRQALARLLVLAKVELQLKHLLRATRTKPKVRSTIEDSLPPMRAALRGATRAETADKLRGYEGSAARAYFSALPHLVSTECGEDMRPKGRSRRPPRDPFNALLSFAYGLLYRDLLSAIIRVGLEPALGFFHRPRSAAAPLALDLMELFRVPVVDMAVLGAVNRRTFDSTDDFTRTGAQVWLSDTGRKKLIELYERRKHEEHKHPILDYSLSYARMMELEVRLLEKEYSGEAGLFARFRIR